MARLRSDLVPLLLAVAMAVWPGTPSQWSPDPAWWW